MSDPERVGNLVRLTLPPERFKMNVRTGIRSDPRFTAAEKNVAQLFAEFATPNGNGELITWVSYAQARKETGSTARTIASAIAKLLTYGYLVLVASKAQHKSPRYRLCMGTEPASTDPRAYAGRGRKPSRQTLPVISTPDPARISKDDVDDDSRPCPLNTPDPARRTAQTLPVKHPDMHLSFTEGHTRVRAREDAPAPRRQTVPVNPNGSRNGWQPREGSLAAKALQTKNEDDAPSARLSDEEDNDLADFSLWKDDDA